MTGKRYRSFSIVLAVFILTLICITGCTGSNKYNILIITVDTLRADRLGYAGYTGARTPAIDELASGAFVFENAYAAAPLTLPSHASLFTGLYPPQTGVRNNGVYVLNRQYTTLAEIMKSGGYRTGAAVGAFVLDGIYGLDQGFDFYEDDIGEGIPGYEWGGERKAEEVVHILTEWLETGQEQPFFFWLHLFDPHAPYDPHMNTFGDRYRERPYDGEVAYTDLQIRKLTDYMKEKGFLENTVVLFMSDHGEGLGDHGESTHGLLLYESTVKVPLFVRIPGSAAGGRIAERVSLVDVFPTVTDIAGLDHPVPGPGKSLLDVAGGENRLLYAETRMPLLAFNWSPGYCLIRGNWKYVDFPRPELYDLKNDPGEENNLVAGEDRKAAAMKDDLKNIRTEMEKTSFRSSRRLPTVEEESRLRSLGYLSSGGNRKLDRDGPLPDPKNRIRIFNALRKAIQILSRPSGYLEDEVIGAREFMEQYLEDEGKSPEVYRSLYEYHRNSGDYEKSLALARESLELFPGDPRILRDLAFIYLEGGKPAKALETFEKLREEMPANTSASFNIARINYRTGNLDRALAEFLDLLDRDIGWDEKETVHGFCGSIYREMGRYSEAIKHLEEVLKPLPEGFLTRWDLARLYELTGDYERALKEFLVLVDSAPDDHHRALAHYYIGRIYRYRKSRSETAVMHYREALKLAGPELREVLSEELADTPGQ